MRWRPLFFVGFVAVNVDSEVVVGQRWLSEAESELGLGTVERVEGRAVSISFAASEELRTYGVDTAPLSRVRFDVGDHVEDLQGAALTVTDVEDHDGVLFYNGLREDGSRGVIPEPGLSDRLQLNRPQDKLLSSRLDGDDWFRLRYETWQHLARESQSEVFGLAGPRVGLIPHQMYIAREVSNRLLPRVMLADEVGLGKTIEAGLILHRLMLIGQVKRVLIVVPEALLHQWLVEILRRFNLRFSLFNAERFSAEQDASDEDDVEPTNEGAEEEVGEVAEADTEESSEMPRAELNANPFEAEQRVLCSQEFLLSQGTVARAALAAEWDMLVVDEAHHLHWTVDESSLAYDFMQALAQQVEGLLLLTATPEQLGREGHFGRLHLLDPNRFHDYDSFVEEETQYEQIATIANRLLAAEPLEKSEQKILTALLGEKVSAQPEDAERLIQALIDRHGTGRVLYRNTRAAIQGFPGREVHAYPLALPEAYASSNLLAEDAITPELGLLSNDDYEAQPWLAVDGRVKWVADQLKSLYPEKVLLICAHAETALALRAGLRKQFGIRGAVFHEAMDIIERDRAAADFADSETGAQLLICSEIGSEGRNFQFAHHLVLFDLPLDPGLLEQRIGRLDRIGQTETIQIHCPYFEDSAGAHLFAWYAQGLNALQQVCPAASLVYEEMQEALWSALAGDESSTELVEQAQIRVAQLNDDLQAGRDRLLEQHSHRPEQAAEIVDAIEASDDDASLRDYMARYWDSYGVESEPGPGESLILHAGHHMLHSHFPELPDEGVTVTLGRADALVHEDRQYLSWEHPMVRGAMDLLSSGELGAAAMTVLRHRGFRPGTLLLEIIFVAECAAPPEYRLQRFLPQSPMRYLLNAKGGNYASRVALIELQGECMRRERKTARAVIKSQQNTLRDMVRKADKLAEKALEGLVADAVQAMEESLGGELERLQALAAVNPNVPAEEIEMLALRRTMAKEFLNGSRMRLDALRVIVTK